MDGMGAALQVALTWQTELVLTLEMCWPPVHFLGGLGGCPSDTIHKDSRSCSRVFSSNCAVPDIEMQPVRGLGTGSLGPITGVAAVYLDG